MNFRSAARSVDGCVRDHNEDAILDRNDLALWVVADGMGGHAAGDVASQAIVDRLGRVAAASSLPRMCDEVEQALHDVNQDLRTQSEANGQRMMGSTVVFLTIKQDIALFGWAGDSRAYRMRDGSLVQLSRDHSHVEELVARGQLTPEQAIDHPQANIVTRAVGGEARLLVDYVLSDVLPGDRFLLCSDGLNKELSDARIQELMAKSNDLGGCADDLINEALERGGHDNTSVILVELDDASVAE